MAQLPKTVCSMSVKRMPGNYNIDNQQILLPNFWEFFMHINWLCTYYGNSFVAKTKQDKKAKTIENLSNSLYNLKQFSCQNYIFFYLPPPPLFLQSHSVFWQLEKNYCWTFGSEHLFLSIKIILWHRNWQSKMNKLNGYHIKIGFEFRW